MGKDREAICASAGVPAVARYQAMNLNATDWVALWKRIGAQGDAQRWFAKIVRAYGEAHRFYHNAEHIAECLQELRDAKFLIGEHHDEIEMAVWLHDVVYDPTRHDNEPLSAQFGADLCHDAQLPVSFAKHLEELILATRHNATPRASQAQWMVDIDLSILGKPEDRFSRYERDVRKEYGFVPEEIFRSKRAEIMEAFLRRDRIFNHAFFVERYEKQARENLTASIGKLRSRV
jgi:predicted metal-dependent HD superfamily phosphohydrolase